MHNGVSDDTHPTVESVAGHALNVTRFFANTLGSLPMLPLLAILSLSLQMGACECRDRRFINPRLRRRPVVGVVGGNDRLPDIVVKACRAFMADEPAR